MKIKIGWEPPRDYVLRYWLLSFCWYRPVKQLRVLGLSITVSR